jgi:hypothetical protein
VNGMRSKVSLRTTTQHRTPQDFLSHRFHRNDFRVDAPPLA